MPTKKIRELEDHERCIHPEHNPPMHQYFPPGVYEHTCPECGHRQGFTVRNVKWAADFSEGKLS